MKQFQIKDAKLVQCDNNKEAINFINKNELKTDITPDYVLNILNKEKKHTQIDIFNDCIYGSIINYDTDNVGDIIFYIIDNNLNIIYDDDIDIEKLIFNLDKEIDNYLIEEQTNKIILFMLLNIQIREDNSVINQYQDDIDQLEDNLIAETNADYQIDILNCRKNLMYLKKRYYTLNEFIYNSSINRKVNIGIEEYISLTLNNCNRMTYEINSMVDHTIQLKEMYQSILDYKMNDIMKFFTVVSSVFLPLTLIVGWYGMNFTNMPELDWEHGYTVVIILSIAILSLMIYFIKKKGFLGK